MPDSRRMWKVLSLVLLSALIVSLALNVYQAFFASTTVKSEAPFEFDFTWSLGTQEIINGTFRIRVKMWIDGDNVTMIFTANDDDYNDWDYIGIVFDTNQNGYIDLSDEPFVMFANNDTHESLLGEYGELGFPSTSSEPGPQNVTFQPESGYVFAVQFPFLNNIRYDPGKTVKEGQNQLQVCFKDQDAEDHMKIGNVAFARLSFYEEG